jgi:hypothetical protein
MAIPIKSSPVLTGKAAREFHERWSNFKDDTSKEEAQRIHRECKEFFAKQKHLYD